MSAARAIAERRVDLLDAFTERAEARAFLWSIGEFSLSDAVDVLQHDAKRDGLIDRVGQEAVQAILADAFQPYHRATTEEKAQDNDCGCDPCPWPSFCQRAEDEARRLRTIFQRPKQTEGETPQTTVEAIMYCVRERGLGALNEAANLERLSRCDPAARTQINKRIATLIEKKIPL